jgi:hypothetical protein
MSNAAKGQGSPAASTPNTHRSQAAALDRALLELERRKLVELGSGRIKLTREGYLELARRFPRRGRS